MKNESLMNQELLYKKFRFGSIILLGISLFMPAFSEADGTPVYGALALFAGFSFPHWYANPLLIGSWFLFKQKRAKYRLILSIAASLLAFMFLIHPIEFSDSHVLVGYWVWLGSSLCSSVSAYFFMSVPKTLWNPKTEIIEKRTRYGIILVILALPVGFAFGSKVIGEWMMGHEVFGSIQEGILGAIASSLGTLIYVIIRNRKPKSN